MAQLETFETFLVDQHKAGKNVIVFVDEAQLLDSECLELVRTLLNFETHTEKLIQIVLSGQLDLRERLLQKKHKAFRSRIFAPVILNAMNREETSSMIQYRCDYCGPRDDRFRSLSPRIAIQWQSLTTLGSDTLRIHPARLTTGHPLLPLYRTRIEG